MIDAADADGPRYEEIETPAEAAIRKDRVRKERRQRWEGEVGPEAVAAADAQRLAMLRLKHRLAAVANGLRETRRDMLKCARAANGVRGGSRMARPLIAAKSGGRARLKVEARCVQIAHAFMRGTSYARTERICWTKPDWVRVGEILTQHMSGSEQVFQQRLEQWMQAALRHLDDGAFKGYEPTRAEIIDRMQAKRDKLSAAIALVSGPMR